MKTRNNPTATISAMALGLLVALSTTAAIAQPSGKAAVYFPRPLPAVSSARPDSEGVANCDCSKMKGDAAMRDHCMATMGEPAGKSGKHPGGTGSR